jgi:hypothetical protein
MSQIVVDTDVASYIFNWHSSAQRYVDALRGSELILSVHFMGDASGRGSGGWLVNQPAGCLDCRDGAMARRSASD